MLSLSTNKPKPFIQHQLIADEDIAYTELVERVIPATGLRASLATDLRDSGLSQETPLGDALVAMEPMVEVAELDFVLLRANGVGLGFVGGGDYDVLPDALAELGRECEEVVLGGLRWHGWV